MEHNLVISVPADGPAPKDLFLHSADYEARQSSFMNPLINFKNIFADLMT